MKHTKRDDQGRFTSVSRKVQKQYFAERKLKEEVETIINRALSLIWIISLVGIGSAVMFESYFEAVYFAVYAVVSYALV